MLIISGCKLENRFDEMATVRNMCRDVYGFQLDSKMELLSWVRTVNMLDLDLEY
jgi:hypothetical protein